DGEDHRVVLRPEPVERQPLAKRAAVLHRDAADPHQPGDLGLGEAARRLVAGDSVFVEPAGLGPGVVDHDVVALHRQPVRRRKPGGPLTDDGYPLAGRRGADEWMLPPLHQAVGGIALEPPDLDRLALGRLADAGFLAELLGRADAGAHTAEDVLLPD